MFQNAVSFLSFFFWLFPFLIFIYRGARLLFGVPGLPLEAEWAWLACARSPCLHNLTTVVLEGGGWGSCLGSWCAGMAKKRRCGVGGWLDAKLCRASV